VLRREGRILNDTEGGDLMLQGADRIKPTDDSIGIYLADLRKKRYQIPTFQRDVVWDRDSVKKLWDSIYRFYPIGSILIWKTDTRLHNHREVGGHIITDELPRTDYRYILDGQQRTVSLLTSLYGGRIKGKEGFDPTLYFDLTVEEQDDDEHDQLYRERFLFWDDIDDKGGKVTRNAARKKRYDQGVIVKLRDVLHNYSALEKRLDDMDHGSWDDPYRQTLIRMRNVLDNYRISFIELRGIEVSEVCEIFERINQEGKPLDIYDIVVAKTYRPAEVGIPGFYLRELIENFRKKTGGAFADEVDDLTYLQMLAVIIMENVKDSGVRNITKTYLNRIRTEHIEQVWSDTVRSFLKTFDFFENHLYIKGPRLVPYRYFYMTLVSYFYRNSEPDYELLKKYFWYYSFHAEELLRNTTHLQHHIAWLRQHKQSDTVPFPLFVLDRYALQRASYSSRGRLSRAILSLLSNQHPRDWKHTDRIVISDTYYLLTDRPNLHHIFPVGYLAENPGVSQVDANSLMNIAFLPQITNLEISDKNPLDYLQEYDNGCLEEVLTTHLIPPEILYWARQKAMPENAVNVFVEGRTNLIIDGLRTKLAGLDIRVVVQSDPESYNSF